MGYLIAVGIGVVIGVLLDRLLARKAAAELYAAEEEIYKLIDEIKSKV